MALLLLCPADIVSAAVASSVAAASLTAAASSSAAFAFSTYSAPAVAVATIFTAPHQHLKQCSDV